MKRRRAIVIASTLLWLGHSGAALATRSPFGVATPDSNGAAFTGPFGGFFVWVAMWQSEFYKALTDGLMHVKESGHAFLLLAGVSFLYGVFHAVGPGHGKAVITSYLLVSRQTVKRGIAISLAAALMQGAVAIAIVLVAAVVLRSTAVEMTRATDWFEIMSYALIVAVGAWLLWTRTLGRHHHHGHAHVEPHAHGEDSAGGPHHHAHDHGHEHSHDHGHGHDHDTNSVQYLRAFARPRPAPLVQAADRFARLGRHAGRRNPPLYRGDHCAGVRPLTAVADRRYRLGAGHVARHLHYRLLIGRAVGDGQGRGAAVRGL